MLKVGDPAPPFEAQTADGARVRLADFAGRKLVLYFYPMDETPHCTRQACSLRDHNGEIAARGAAILGVSGQSADSHRRFSEHHKLNFPLLVDRDHAIARAYGALGGGLFGVITSALGIYRRITYLIDEQGRIAHVEENPDVSRQGEDILKLL